MRWRDGRRSSNIEDQRGERNGGRVPLRIGKRGGLGGGIGTIVLVLAALYFGVDPTVLLQGSGSQIAEPSRDRPADYRPSADEQQLADFVSVVLADTEETWHTLFQESGERYREPKLVLFTDEVRSACGRAEAAMGPFYCPGDSKVYIDLGFYDELKQRFGAPGDFAQAYVIAHEVGHHVQSLLGISSKVHQAQQQMSKAEGNQLSVRLELQADCFAGLWAHHADRTRNILERGDIDEALNAAAAIGDDRLQHQAQGRVTPDSFTHGSSAQRQRWFKKGLTAGNVSACNTFDQQASL